jgi:hypothetical protein
MSYALPMRKTFVPHVGQEPCIAGRPFFNVICLAPLISTFFLHFMQYAVAITTTLLSTDWARTKA